MARPGYCAVLGKEPRETLVRALDLSAEQGFAVGFAVDIAAVDPPFSELRVTRSNPSVNAARRMQVRRRPLRDVSHGIP